MPLTTRNDSVRKSFCEQSFHSHLFYGTMEMIDLGVLCALITPYL